VNPEVKRLDVVEISPEVIESLPLFGRHTHQVHEDSRLRILRGDARLLLRSGDPRWDVIVSEPSNLWMAGADALFSHEFFTSARSSLKPGGVYMRWLQLYKANCEMVYIVLRTLHGLFDEIRAFTGSQGDLLLLAAPDPGDRPSAIRRRRRMPCHARGGR